MIHWTCLPAVVTVVANEDDLPSTGGTKVGAGEGLPLQWVHC